KTMTTNRLPKIFAIALALLIACGKQEGDKKAQLETLKTQQAETADKIKALEAEIALTDTAPKAETTKAKLVKVDTIKLSAFNHFVEIQGQVDTDDNIVVTGETPGILVDLKVKTGDKVSKGTVLGEVDATIIRKAIAEVETSYDLVKTIFEKQEKLYKDNVGTEIQYLQAKSNKESLEAKMVSLREQLKKTKITSPINGYVDEVMTKEGEMVSQMRGSFRIVNNSGFKIKGEIAESYVGKVNIGDEVTVRFPDLNKELKAKISVVGSSISEMNRTFALEIKLPAMSSEIKPNMIAYLKINDFTKAKAVVVPINTVQKSATGNYIFVVSDKNTTERRVVTLGNTYGSDALITEGLKSGDKVITFGFSDLVDGQAVKF
ncbi:MAG: efflux RND transporter periplasmic adaptor subunit, partial [Cytophagales bacterium]